MANIRVVYEDANFIIVDKSAGLLVHGTRVSLREPNLTDWLKNNYPEVKNVGDDPEYRPGIIHRLDKDTSGLIIIARNQKTFEYLKKLFQDHAIKKNYIALVWGDVQASSGTINEPIGLKRGTTRRTTSLKGVKLVKDAVTSFQKLETLEFNGQKFTLLKVLPLTGRTHQIRVHLNSLNHPVVGDGLYGGAKQQEIKLKLSLSRQFLHAESVEFTDQNGSRINVSSDLPEDLESALNLLRAGQGDLRKHN